MRFHVDFGGADREEKAPNDAVIFAIFKEVSFARNKWKKGHTKRLKEMHFTTTKKTKRDTLKFSDPTTKRPVIFTNFDTRSRKCSGTSQARC